MEDLTKDKEEQLYIRFFGDQEFLYKRFMENVWNGHFDNVMQFADDFFHYRPDQKRYMKEQFDFERENIMAD